MTTLQVDDRVRIKRLPNLDADMKWGGYVGTITEIRDGKAEVDVSHTWHGSAIRMVTAFKEWFDLEHLTQVEDADD